MSLNSNNHLEDLNDKTDLLNLREKGDAITLFLESNTDIFKTDKMIAIYGNWGSGKTTLMKYIGKKVKSDMYVPIWFNTWKYEKDENIGLSLLSVMSEGIKDQKILKDLFKAAWILLKGFGKSVSVELPIKGVTINGDKLVETIEEEYAKEFASKSYHNRQIEFERLFKELESKLIGTSKESKNKRIIVFIDDLDRCEPENVIDIMAMIKLFFTYGNRTIFVCGIDKDSVSKAIRTRYQDIFKAEEYLEKIFDYSFNIDNTGQYNSQVSDYFKRIKIKNDILAYRIEILFTYLNFTNPRHVKKVLNKFEILRSIANSISHPKISEIPPSLKDLGKTDNYIEIILLLYFIILHEFHYEYWKMYTDMSLKQKEISRKVLPRTNNEAESHRVENARATFEQYSNIVNMQYAPQGVAFQLEAVLRKGSGQDSIDFMNIRNALLLLFLPADCMSVRVQLNQRLDIEQFKNLENSVVVDFCHYLDDSLEEFFSQPTSDYKFADYISLTRRYL